MSGLAADPKRFPAMELLSRSGVFTLQLGVADESVNKHCGDVSQT